MRDLPSGWARYYAVVRRVPRGKVATYGQVALVAGTPRAARQVGYALAALRGAAHDVPWQRIVGARPRGQAAVTLLDPVGAAVQRDLLEREGVAFDGRGRIDLARFGWRAGRPRAGPGPVTPGSAPAGSSRSARRTRGSSGRKRTSRSGRR